MGDSPSIGGPSDISRICINSSIIYPIIFLSFLGVARFSEVKFNVLVLSNILDVYFEC